jgi:cysteine-rich repeat protein
VCGDGVQTAEEECDNGASNVAGEAYGGCSAGTCELGPYCGDKVINGPETCDDGVNLSVYGSTGCAPGCVAPPNCGDGLVQGQFEECDDASTVGQYGGCTEICTLGPRCGDGVLHQDGGEQCDDANRENGDGCDANCRREGVR